MEEMIKKQITLLIPRSQEERFNNLTKDFENFTIEAYEETTNSPNSVIKRKTLALQIISSKIKV